MNDEKLLSIDEALVAIYQELQQLKTMLIPQHQLSELEQRARIADILHNVVGLNKANAMKSAGFDTSLWESPEGEKPNIPENTFDELATAIKSLSDALKEVEEEDDDSAVSGMLDELEAALEEFEDAFEEEEEEYDIQFNDAITEDLSEEDKEEVIASAKSLGDFEVVDFDNAYDYYEYIKAKKKPKGKGRTFDASKHPRDARGRFISTGGSERKKMVSELSSKHKKQITELKTKNPTKQQVQKLKETQKREREALQKKLEKHREEYVAKGKDKAKEKAQAKKPTTEKKPVTEEKKPVTEQKPTTTQEQKKPATASNPLTEKGLTERHNREYTKQEEDIITGYQTSMVGTKETYAGKVGNDGSLKPVYQGNADQKARAKKEVEAQQKMLLNSKIGEAGVVYRGQNKNSPTIQQLEGMQPGDVLTQKGFASTTIDRKTATEFGDATIEIEVSPETRGVYLPANKGRDNSTQQVRKQYADEKELLMPANATWRLKSKETGKDGKPIYRVEIVEQRDFKGNVVYRKED